MSTVAEIRQRCAVQLLTLTPDVLTTESEAPYAFIRLPNRSPVNGEFAVGVPDTAPIPASGGRQRPSEGQHSDTRVMVGSWHQVTVDRVREFDAILEIEAATRNALVAKGWSTSFSLTWLGTTRTPGADGWIFLDHTFQATHLLPLQ